MNLMHGYTVGESSGQYTVIRWTNGRAKVVARLDTEREARAEAIALQAEDRLDALEAGHYRRLGIR
jgi:hypothetical protein